MGILDAGLAGLANWIWGFPLLALLSGGGLFFFIRSRGLTLRRLPLAFAVLSGRYDKGTDPGEINHYKALSVALAATIGMGNISGVAIAVNLGGPGVVFWMWVAAIVGMATKYFTCTLAVMYRGRDSAGHLQGGPMYVITEGLGAHWRPLAVWFCVAGLFGCLPLFTVNQLTQAIQDLALAPNEVGQSAGSLVGGVRPSSLVIGLVLAGLTALVVLGGLRRISDVVAGLVPFMVGVYFLAVIGIVLTHASAAGDQFLLIFSDAFSANFFSGESAFGGALGGLIVLGARRATFSNEAGIGTAPMAHGAAKTSEPVHEGLVAMLGPVIDTLIVCTLTALAILSTGVWQSSGANGVSLTAEAFAATYGRGGGVLLLMCILAFGISSLLSYSYFGAKCFSFLFGAHRVRVYLHIYTASIFVGALSSLAAILNFIDIMFALMAIPTIVSAILLSPHVVRRTRHFFDASTAPNGAEQGGT